MKAKRIMVCLAAAAMFVMTTAGCTAKKNGTSASEASKSKVTLTMWDYFEGVNSQRGVKALITAFNASQNDIEIDAVFTPRDEMDKQLSIGLISNKLPDIVLIDGCDYASRISMGLFADVTDNFNRDFGAKTDDFYAGPLLSCKAGDKYYGVPFGCNDLGFYYNKDMFKAAGITKTPATWAEMTAICAKLSKNGVYGLALSAIKNDEGSFQFMPWLYSTGATYDKINTPEGIKSFALLQDYVKKGYISKEAINWTQADAEKQFATGKAAMMLNGPWNIETVKTDAPQMNFGVIEIPKDIQYASVTGGENIGIIKGHHEAEAWEFLKFTVNNSLLYIDDMGYIPCLKSLAAQDKTLEDPLIKPFVTILDYATPRGPSAQWPKVSAALYTAEQQVMLNQKTPKDAADEAQKAIDAALQ
jgi:ABC-type sugar transport system, periplasmic component